MSVAAVAAHSAQVIQARNTIRANNLNSPDGRTSYLVEKVQPYLTRAAAINQEVQDIFAQLNTPLLIETAQTLSAKLEEKIETLGQMTPVIDGLTQFVDDLNRIDSLLDASPPLNDADQATLLRIADMCSKLNVWTQLSS